MSRQKEYFLVVDTETCNGTDEPLPYDIGYAICDREGNIYKTESFLVEETFCLMKDTMASAYYAEKIPRYWEDVKNGTRKIRGIYYIRKVILEDIKTYNIKKVCAYNMAFDRRATNYDMRYLTKSKYRYFFPYGLEYVCIWNMACQVLLSRPTYIKFALDNGFVSEKGNIQTSAECCYRYLTKDSDFIESHTGLEDVLIEVEILAKCFSTHKKMDKGINTCCWRLPQKARKEIEMRKGLA